MIQRIKQLLDKKNLKLPFVYDVSHSLITKGITIAIGVAASIIVTRTLGPELKGVYAIVITWVGVLLQISLFGMHTSNSYYVALHPNRLKTLLSNSVLFILSVCGLITVGLLLSRYIFKIPMGLPEHNLLIVIIIGTFLSMGNILLQNLCIAVRRVNYNNYVLIAAKILSFALLLYFYIGNLLTVQNALIVYLLELLVMVVVLFPFLSQRDSFRFEIDLTQLKQSFGYGFRVYQAALISFLVIRSDIFLIKYLLTYEQVGYYGTAVQITDQVSVMSATIAGILLPRLTMIKNITEKKFRTKQVVLVIAVMLACIILPLFIFAEQIIVLLFGVAFIPSVMSLRILLFATGFLSLLTILIQFLASEGFPKVIVVVWFVALLMNVGMNLLFIPKYGIEGAATSSFISYLFVLLCMLQFVRKKYITKPKI